MAVMTIRVDEKIKAALQQKAKDLGLSLNQFVNLVFRDALGRGEVRVNFEDEIEEDKELTWTPEREKAYQQAKSELERGEAYTLEDLDKLLATKWALK